MATEKKVFRGWLPRDYKITDPLEWDRFGELMLAADIYKHKGCKANWECLPKAYPPKRVTITVEIEENQQTYKLKPGDSLDMVIIKWRDFQPLGEKG